ncbi:MAG: acyl-CoA dehydrogenase [Candidatus Eisenbacteria bacterium]|nr:acyl-CoA dehydrogenase [Candidatus Eisenbacteria bacterium]
MDFRLSEEHRLIQETARDFAEKELRPRAAAVDAEARFPAESVKKLAELGFLGIFVPEEYDGSGLDQLSYAIIVEELSRACAATGVIVSAHNSLVCFPLLRFGTDDQKDRYLRKLARGEVLGSFALTEPEAGSDAASQRTVATSDGSDFLLNGSKIFITNATVAEVFIVFCLTDPTAGVRGISALIVERGMPGFTVGRKEETMGIRGSGACMLSFEDVRVPRANLLGEENRGFRIAMATLDCGRIGIAAQAVGIAQACLDESVRYAKERRQFGKPIGSLQAIQWMIADTATELAAARLLTYQAAVKKDSGEEVTLEAAQAKLYASEAAARAAHRAVQVHGGYGYTKEFAVERLFRDARITEIYEGTSEIQRVVIASQVLR